MITWGQKLGLPECPYVQRWVLDLGLFSVRVHRWLGSDDSRHLHDHPWWYLSLVVRGSYDDVSDIGTRHRSPGTIAFFPATHRHTVQLRSRTCWTILVTGPERRQWGFWVKGKFRKRNKYFFEHGHHPCDPVV